MGRQRSRECVFAVTAGCCDRHAAEHPLDFHQGVARLVGLESRWLPCTVDEEKSDSVIRNQPGWLLVVGNRA